MYTVHGDSIVVGLRDYYIFLKERKEKRADIQLFTQPNGDGIFTCMVQLRPSLMSLTSYLLKVMTHELKLELSNLILKDLR